MKIAVTAATGQLGSSIVRVLKEQIGKENVIGTSRSPEKATQLEIEVRKGDYTSREDFDEAFKGINKVLLVSGNDYPEKRIPQHRNIIEAAKQNGVQKIVYTSIVGDEKATSFSPIVQSNRQTEQDIKESGLDWAIGRNGIYIEPDLEYIDTYLKDGEIRNCAGDGRCSYTSRDELGAAYAQLLLNDSLNGHTYNVVGEPITQGRLIELINEVFGTDLKYNSVSVQDYERERKAELGDFLGTVIAGIYDGIRKGANDLPSDFEKIVGRPHLSPIEMMKAFKNSNG